MNTMAHPIYDIAKQMHNLTDAQVSVSNSSKYSFLCYPIRSSLFCWSIHDVSGIHERCVMCDKKAFEVCQNQKDTYVYKCHMGLTEMICPILDGNNITGYITIGQIVQTEDKEQIIKLVTAAAHKFNLDVKELLDHIDTLPHLSAKKIAATAQYAKIMSEYITNHDLLPKEVQNMAYEIRKYIADNIASELNVPLICDVFHISKSHLNNLLNETFNMSAGKIITHERIAMAKKLIRQGSLNMNAISERVGIYDPNYFSKLFKSATGMTPSRYKKSIKQ